MGSRRLTAWAMARPGQLLHYKVLKKEYFSCGYLVYFIKYYSLFSQLRVISIPNSYVVF
jgi:hypothetical protein